MRERDAPAMPGRSAFALIELLVVAAIIASLAALSLSMIGRVRRQADQAKCAGNLRQLALATSLYLGDHGQEFFPGVTYEANGGKLWFFGYESRESSQRPEGERELDRTRGALHPYLRQAGGVEACPSFDYGSALRKPKFEGATYCYGYNIFLGNRRLSGLARPSEIVVFGDSAQVNTFQAPASARKPLLEEFYFIDSTSRSIHFRHNDRALFAFADGHVGAMTIHPGTLDTRLPEANVGRITPPRSMEHLQ